MAPRKDVDGIPFLIQNALFLRREFRDRGQEALEEAVKAGGANVN